jgi:two-component system response regulator YesN
LLPLEVKGVQYLCCHSSVGSSLKDGPVKDWNDEGWYKAAVMNISESILNKTYVSYSFSFDNNIGLLLHGQKIKTDTLLEYFGMIKEKVNSTLGLSLTVGIGNAYPSLGEIPVSCQEAINALDHMVIMGKNVVIHAGILNHHVLNKVAIVSFENIIKNSENDLIYALKAGDSKAVYQIIDDIISVMKQIIKTDIREKEHLGFLLVFFLTKILSSLNISSHEFLEEPHDLYNKLKNNQTIDEIQNFLCCYLDGVMKELHNRIKGQNGFLVKQAIHYINTNVYNGISLAKVAEHLGIHPNYLSKIFSQETGESFIDYSIKIKLQEAKLLLRNTNNKVYQIADQLHYKDVGHFTRVFKKTYGVSPTEYRQLF